MLLALNWPGMLLVIGAVLAGKIQPALVRDLPTPYDDWYRPVFVLAGLLAVPLAMRAGDVHGRKRALIAVGLFGLGGQIVTALAPTFAVALFGHAVRGFYTPAGPLSMLAMRDCFPRRKFPLVVLCVLLLIGLLVVGTGVASDLIVEALGWRGVVWCLVVLSVLALGLLALAPADDLREVSLRTLDIPGRLLLGGGPMFVMLGVLKGADWGWTSPGVLGAIGIGLVLGVLSWVRARSARCGELLRRRPLASVPSKR